MVGMAPSSDFYLEAYQPEIRAHSIDSNNRWVVSCMMSCNNRSREQACKLAIRFEASRPTITI